MSRLIEGTECQATSAVTEAELPAALARAVRTGMVSRTGGDAVLRAWTMDREALLWIQLPQATLRQAGLLAWEGGLRGYGAVHLAAALWWRASLPQELVIAKYDRELWNAVRRHGLGVFPPGEP